MYRCTCNFEKGSENCSFEGCTGVRVYMGSDVKVLLWIDVQVDWCTSGRVYKCTGVHASLRRAPKIVQLRGVQVYGCTWDQVSKWIGVQVDRCTSGRVYKCT